MKDVILDFFSVYEEDGTKVDCYLYAVRGIFTEDLYLIQGETINALAWLHIEGLEKALVCWEFLRKSVNIIEEISKDRT